MKIALTVLSDRNNIGKSFELSPSGELAKVAAKPPSFGRYEVVEVGSLAALSKLLDKLNHNEAIMPAVPADGSRKGNYQPAKAPPKKGTLTRTSKDWVWDRGPGLLVLDHDVEHYPGIDTPQKLIEALQTAFPTRLIDFSRLHYLVRSSSSGHIWHGDKLVRGQRGMHVYLPVADLSGLTDEFRSNLENRLWLAGLGNIVISKAGSLLERAIVDLSPLKSTHSIFFPGHAQLPDGFEQRRPATLIHKGTEVLNLNWVDVCDEAERSRVADLKEAARSALAVQAGAVRDQHFSGMVERMVVRGMPRERAERIVNAAGRQVLVPGFELRFDDDESTYTVSEVLNNPDQFMNRTMPDPVEPEYGGGVNIAICYGNRIFSQAHGGIWYELSHDSDSIAECFAKLAQEGRLRTDFAKVLLQADLNEIEKHEAAKDIAKRLDTDAVTVKKELIDAEEKDFTTKLKGSGLGDRFAYIASDDLWIDMQRVNNTGELLFLSRSSLDVLLMQRFPKRPATLTLRSKNICPAYDTMTYAPGDPRIIAGNTLNLWRPSHLSPKPGDATPWIELVRKLMGDSAEYFMDWCAYTVQNPEGKINHAMLLFSACQGVGKGTVVEPLRRAVGSRNTAQIHGSQLTEPFNGFLLRSKLLLVDELDLEDKQREYNRMKPMLAAPPETLSVNEKNLRRRDVSNRVAVILMTNNRYSLAIEEDDRRLYPIEITANPMTSTEARTIWRWYVEEGFAVVADFLLNRDLSNFDPKARPAVTSLKQEMADYALTEADQTVRRYLEAKGHPTATSPDKVMQWDMGSPTGSRQPTRKQIAGALGRLGYVRRRCQWREDGKVKEASVLVKREMLSVVEKLEGREIMNMVDKETPFGPLGLPKVASS